MFFICRLKDEFPFLSAKYFNTTPPFTHHENQILKAKKNIFYLSIKRWFSFLSARYFKTLFPFTCFENRILKFKNLFFYLPLKKWISFFISHFFWKDVFFFLLVYNVPVYAPCRPNGRDGRIYIVMPRFYFSILW